MLHDTYGFPLDLTQDALRPRGIKVDVAGFEAAMEAQRQQARAGWTGSGEARTEDIWFAERQRHGATEFLGYETLERRSRGEGPLPRRQGGRRRSRAGESGADARQPDALLRANPAARSAIMATITPASGLAARVTDTQKRLGDLFVHSVTVDEGVLTPGSEIAMTVDAARRAGDRGQSLRDPSGA